MALSRIMIALDADSLGTDVLRVGAELASCAGAELALVTVADSRSVNVSELGPTEQVTLARLRAECERLLDQAASHLRPAPAKAALKLVRDGLPEHEIVAAAADWHADVLVMGTHARGGLARVFKGSTAEWVLHHAPCPVLMVKMSTPPG